MVLYVTGSCTQDEPYRGSCDPEMSRYYYNITKDRCLAFDGCPAVEDIDNSYDSLLACRGRCMGKYIYILMCLWELIMQVDCVC